MYLQKLVYLLAFTSLAASAISSEVVFSNLNVVPLYSTAEEFACSDLATCAIHCRYHPQCHHFVFDQFIVICVMMFYGNEVIFVQDQIHLGTKVYFAALSNVGKEKPQIYFF